MEFFKTTIMAVMAVATIVLGSCSASKNAAAGGSVEGKWAITEACGTSTANGMNPAEITFEKGGKIHGNASVNNFFGDYTLSGNKLQLKNMGMTMMLGEHMEIERAVNEALNSTAMVSVKGNDATVTDSNGKVVMRLKRK